MADSTLTALPEIPSPIMATDNLFYDVQSGTSYHCTGADLITFVNNNAGFVTSVNTLTGAVTLTTANIPDSSGKRYTPDIPQGAVTFGSSDNEHITEDAAHFFYDVVHKSLFVGTTLPAFSASSQCAVIASNGDTISNGGYSATLGGQSNALTMVGNVGLVGALDVIVNNTTVFGEMGTNNNNTMNGNVSANIGTASSNFSNISNFATAGCYSVEGANVNIGFIGGSQDGLINESASCSVLIATNSCNIGGAGNSIICGGYNNSLSSAANAFIGGGSENSTNGGAANYLLGSSSCIMSGNNSGIIGGNTVNNSNTGTLILADNNNISLASTADNQLLMSFANGAALNRTDTSSGLVITSLSPNYAEAFILPFAINYSMTPDDYLVANVYGGSPTSNLTLTLPDETLISIGRQIFIKDESGNFGASGITVSSVNGYNINGNPTYVLNSTGGLWNFYWNANQWIATEIDSSSITIPAVPATAIPFGSSDNVHLTSDVSTFAFIDANASLQMGTSNTANGVSSVVIGGTQSTVDSDSNIGTVIGSQVSSITNSPIGLNGIYSSYAATINNAVSTVILGSTNVSLSNSGVLVAGDSNNNSITVTQDNTANFYFANGISFRKTTNATADVDINGSVNVGYTKQAVTSGSYTATLHDYIIGVNYIGISTANIILPTSITKAGRTLVIKDEANTAGSHPITIQGSSGQTFNNGPTFITISSAGGFFNLYSDGTGWYTH
jgi:hypothetical protein